MAFVVFCRVVLPVFRGDVLLTPARGAAPVGAPGNVAPRADEGPWAHATSFLRASTPFFSIAILSDEGPRAHAVHTLPA